MTEARRRLLTTARALFFELGFSRVSMDEIAQQLGMSKRTHDLQVNGRIRSFGAPVVQARRLLFPVDLAAEDRFVGVAGSNLEPTAGLLEFDRYASSVPESDKIQGFFSKAFRNLPPENQLAELTDQLFPAGPFPRTNNGWFELRSSADQVGSFFQFGTNNLSQLDGSIAITEISKHLIFPRIFEGPTAYRGQPVTTLLSIANPSEETVEVTLRVHPFAAGPTPEGFSRSVNLSLSPLDSLHQSVSEIFGMGLDIAQGFVEVEVTGGPGVIGFERIQLLSEETVIGLNAVSTNSAAETSYSAQFASQAGALFTNLNLINTADLSRDVTLTLIAEDGTTLGDPARVALGAGAQFSQDAAEIFTLQSSEAVPAGNGEFTGSLRVESDGPGIIGDVVFGDPTAFQFAAALPLQSDTFREAVFSQVANVEGFFTGLALFNPGQVSASVQIEVVAADGRLVGQSELELAAGRRTSRLVPELVPDSAGQAGGYVRIRSDQPMIAQQLFAAFDSGGIRLFSAVPPTVLE